MVEHNLDSPNGKLASHIVDVLIDANLVPENERSDISEKLQHGSVTEMDWARWLTEALPGEGVASDE